MEYKALVSFAGKVSMYEGEVKEIVDKDIADDLLKAGYIEKLKTPAKQTRQKKK